jgi:hypothetical protein
MVTLQAVDWRGNFSSAGQSRHERKAGQPDRDLRHHTLATRPPFSGSVRGDLPARWNIANDCRVQMGDEKCRREAAREGRKERPTRQAERPHRCGRHRVFPLQRTSDGRDIVQVCILDVILDDMSLFCTVRNTRTVLQVPGPPRAAGPSVEAKSQAGRAAIGPRPRLLPE